MPETGYPLGRGFIPAAAGYDVDTARTTWAAAGGSTPAITCIDPFNLYTEADPTMGTGAVIDNSWSQIGSECFGHVRFLFGTDSDPGVGFYALTGLPKTPKVTASSGSYARKIGEGIVIDTSASSRGIPVYLFIDPNVHATLPFLYLHSGAWATVQDNAAADRTLIEASALPIVTHNNPFTFDDTDIINITFQYEAA